MTALKPARQHLFIFTRSIVALIAVGLLTVWTVSPASAQDPSQGKDNVRVMTYNVYEGADLTPALSAKTFPDFMKAVGTILTNVQATNPPARAAAIARQIGEAHPTLVSLQEVTEWKTCPAKSDFSDCSAPPTVLYDILNLVKDALQAQGYSYKEVVRVTTNELQAPTLINSTPVLVLYQQRSAILARADIDPSELQLSNIQSNQFAAALTVSSVVGPITIHRAWASVDVNFHDTNFRFIDTQLEAFNPDINYLQGEELLAGPAHTTKSVVIAMDSNSKANPPADPFTPTYTNFLINGFRDAWNGAQGQDAGPTCCQDPSLLNPVSLVSRRIDLILLHGDLGSADVRRFGGQQADRTMGLWPSDHLGVAARLGTE